MAIITGVDSVLGELSRLNGHPRLPSLLTLEIKNLELELRFLKMLFWCFAKWDDAAKEASLGPRVTDIAAQLRKAGQGLYASGLIAIQRGQIKNWKIVASNLLENIERRKPDIEKICLVLLDHSLECNFSTSYEVSDFISTILENLKDLVSSKALFAGPSEKQIIALGEILRFLRCFVDFTATRAVMYEKLEDFWNHVQGCTNKAACVSILFWVRAKAEPKSESVLSDLQQMIEPFTPEVTKMYLGVLKASKLSPSDTSLMGQVVATFVDSLLKNLPVCMEDYVRVLGAGLMFLIAFLIDPPKESKLGGNLIWTKVDDIVSDAASFICSFGIDQTRFHIADGWNKFLRELFQKIDLVKADIKKLYFQDSDSSLSDFPKTNGLGFIDFLLGKLAEIVKCNNLDVDTFTKYQIESIQKQLQYFQIILEPQNEPEEDISMQIINVAYRAEHVIDCILVMDAPIWYHMVNLSDVTQQMKLIKLDIEKMEAKHRDDIRVLNDGTESSNDLPTEANFSRIDDVIVGFEDDTTTIIDQLTSGSKQLEIVSILGMPGGGKTTLAKKIFNSRVILCHFEIYAWCYVSQVHSRRNSLLNILNHTAVLDYLTSELSDEQLAERLYEYLEHRRFLIVLDDIWDIEAWDELRSSIPNNDNGSRILLTSRIHNVALQANSNMHFLRPLSDEECLKLLKMKLFRNDVCPPELLKVCLQIAKNCKGLPLAVVLIAGIRARKEKYLDFWEQIAQSLNSHIASEGYMDILELSYKHLPDVLRSCFLYFGTFQNGTIIKVKKLIRLWSAEGLIQVTDRKSLEDLANEYLMDLVSRSLIIIDSRSSNERIKKCHVHDLLHYLCVTKGEEKGLFQLVNTSQLQSNGINYNQYRLCIHTEWRSFINSKPTGQNVRSLLFNPNNSSNEHPYAPEFCNGFQVLRVLDLEALQCGVLFPSEIFLLVHLRYLAVAGDFTSIPSSIDSLSYLETLLVRSYGSMIVLPNTIFNIKRLVHVDIPTGATFSWDDVELEKSNLLSNLVTFSSLYVSRKEDAEMLLRLLPNVQILRFQFYNQFPALDFLDNLESLKVHKIGRAPYRYSFKFPSTLRELTLSNLGLAWEKMSAIAELTSLEALKLLSRSFEGPCWNMRDVLRLKFLKLESLNITEWNTYNDSLPRLQRLVVKNCSMLEEIPYSFGKIPTLKIIEVSGCKSSVAKSAEIILQELQDLRNDEIQAIVTPELRKGQHHSFPDIIEVPGCHSSVAESANILQEHEDLGNDEIQGIMTPEFKKGEHPSFSDVKEDLTGSKEIKKSLAVLGGRNKFFGDNGEEVGLLLDNLKEFVQYNAKSIGGVGDSVHNLIRDLGTLKAFIDKSTKNYGNDFLGSLPMDVRDMIFEAEDAIETYIFSALRQKVRGATDKTFRAVNHALEMQVVGKDLEKVRKRVQEFYQQKAKLGLEAMKIDTSTGTGKMKKVFVVEEDVVGFEDEAKKVIDLLTLYSEQLEVISIIGMPGIGKTTLARKVFKHPAVEYTFWTRIFINVSQEYKRREVFLNILMKLTSMNEEVKNMSDEELVEVIREKLAKGNYLVVMDDIWSVDAWEELKVAFPKHVRFGKVLITSRQRSVARSANPKLQPLDMRFLNHEESRTLLRKKVFGENSCPKELEEYEISILQKCNGLPLAIVVAAGILLNNRDRIYYWKKVGEGVGNLNPNNQERTIDLIKLSYNNLPYHLKLCFLYLGMFPEDFEIPVWKLLRLWVAEGFIPGSREGWLEDKAEQYLEELVDRSLVMVEQERSDGQIKTCRMHNTLRDFCKNEAMGVNLLQEIRPNQATSSLLNPSLHNCRRLFINSHVFSYVTSKPSGKYVRSFLSFAKEEITLPREHISSISKAFKLLRVLDVSSVKFSLFPSELYYLVLLKYISIYCDCNKLRGKLSNLQNLQTLIIETTSSELAINADIWKMAKLRHVHINTSTILQKVKEGSPSLKNLQTLSTISPESCRKEVFARTPNLKKLCIRGKLAIFIEDNCDSSLFDSFSKLESLENLKLLNDDITAKLHTLPSEKKFPRKLTRLTLSNTLLDWKHMSTLGKLQNLEALKLKDNAFDGKVWETEEGGFPVLKVLHIGSSANFAVWRASASHFPQLTSLFVRHCTKLEALPLDLGQIPSLQRIDLHCTSPFVANSARKIQMFKLELQNENTKNNGFKLSVYPPDL